MAASGRERTAGRVGRAHGLDGSFFVNGSQIPLAAGDEVTVAGRARRVEHVRGTAQRPLLRLAGISSREAARELTGEALLVPEDIDPVGEGEYLIADLVGCEVPGLAPVTAVLQGPSCDVLELEDGTLVPLVSDAVRSVDVEKGRIEVNRAFLGLGEREEA